MTRPDVARATAGLAAVAFVLGACGGANKPAAQLTNKLEITGTEYKFELDRTSITEGTAEVTFRNTGAEEHVAGWGRLKSGVTFETFSEALLNEAKAAEPNWDQAFGLLEQSADGAPGAIGPGQTAIITTSLLRAGTYALICFIPTANKDTAHFQEGMLTSFEVNAAGTPAPAPFDVKTDGEVGMTEYSFGTLPEALETGKGTFKFTNAGKEPHRLVIERFEPGKTFADADTYFKPLQEGMPPTGPAPVTLVGGFNSIPPGSSIWVTIDLAPGSYGLDCDEEIEPGKSHGEDLGMRTTFEVA